MMTLPAFVSATVDQFRYAPLVIQIAVSFTVIAVSLTAIAYISILLNRYRSYRRDKKLAVLHPMIDDLLTEHILMNEALYTDEPVDAAIPLDVFDKPIFEKKWARQVLIQRLMQYRDNVQGAMGVQLRSLYLQLGLDKDSLRKLKSSRWDHKIQALGELTNMDIPIADVIILPLTNSRNRELRATARHAYIKLSKNEPFKFFDVATEPLLQWDQVELFRIISTTDRISIPNFAQWITYSSNKSIVSFCLKLVEHYQQLSAVPAVVKLLDTRDHYLRANAINCLGKLRIESVEDKLVGMYDSQPHQCRIEILKALGRISTGKHIGFLRQEFLHSSDFEIRKHAAKSLINNQWAAGNLINELVDTATRENKLILKHCMNPLIKF
ncbi:HEAT repeat domain-containing protein [Chitinophaga qingshengii]|uniref:HEAT repeat domain-containing protein n=1 Tax=Chitinophaga qingshengii TaxID=1569794 RepID=A0ABR7TW05_9BACT|nr:HEAT repeat domain-containing protein [Chitinophaga qingshengii]MBC9933174.1 HEAT repeat domain-containing protein [Chitinophaga qingshengii]